MPNLARPETPVGNERPWLDWQAFVIVYMLLPEQFGWLHLLEPGTLMIVEDVEIAQSDEIAFEAVVVVSEFHAV